MWSRTREVITGTALIGGATLLVLWGFLGDDVVLAIGHILLGTTVGVGFGLGVSAVISAMLPDNVRVRMAWNKRSK